MYGTADQIRQITGIKANDIKNIADETALTTAIETWLTWLSNYIDSTLLQGAIDQSSDPMRYKSVEMLTIMRVSKLISYIRKNQVGDMATADDLIQQLAQESGVLEGLSDDLRPLQKRRVSVFQAGDINES